MATKTECDRCGKELKETSMFGSMFSKHLFCRRCELLFEEWLESGKRNNS